MDDAQCLNVTGGVVCLARQAVVPAQLRNIWLRHLPVARWNVTGSPLCKRYAAFRAYRSDACEHPCLDRHSTHSLRLGLCFFVMDLMCGFRACRASAAYLADRARVLRSMDRLFCVLSVARLRGCGFSMLNGMVTLHVRSRGVCPLMMAVTPKS